MKHGLEEGHQAVIHVVVTPEMFAQFEGHTVHQAYSTVSMIYHMEWVSRKIILPYLESHEEGMGVDVSARHIAPAVNESELTITARVAKVKNDVVHTNVTVYEKHRLIGEGTVTQVVLPRSKIFKLLHQN
ncbi:thioesterase family protein [Cytobacillus purgationiresistens]|uniref:Thioesterase n=1 Tax=Cytobacillus purgationiresistens TaxID=863449 RepID=A0ABU0AEG1_9BACI|nr:thioesterase [Cytobacillus purgationiresistens]MDQ0269638.1 putative thioesterase [Cytobacillus purgationiresistens]